MGVHGLCHILSIPSFELLDGINGYDDSQVWKNHSFKNNMRVLLVDDSATEQKIWSKILEILGVQSHAAKNGIEAVDLFSAGEKFDLVLMDKYMPIMNGVEAIRRLRSMGVSAKIVGIGSSSTNEEKQEFLAVGVDDYAVKPVSPAKFVSWLQEVDENY